MIFDVAVIGAGVVGTMIARELSRYNIKIAMLEKNSDVATGTTKANSAIVHAGFDAENGTLKAKLNVRGTALMPQICKELNVPFKEIGSLVLAYSDEEKETLKVLYERGLKNGVERMSVLDFDEVKAIEPNISDEVKGALLAETAGIVCPYELAIASAQNAVDNGATFFRNSEVVSISYNNDCFTLGTASGSIEAKYVINAAGTDSDIVAGMIDDNSFRIVLRKGEYYLLDKSESTKLSHVLFPCPSKLGKGILLSPTVDGNVIAGPTSEDIPDRDDTGTTPEALAKVTANSTRAVPGVSLRSAITSFSGIRAHTTNADNDFIIGSSDKNKKFINVAGIESPGLSSAPAIAEYVAEILFAMESFEKKDNFNPVRPAPVRFRELNTQQRKELIAKDKRYGKIICRCETVTEGEIIDAIHTSVGAVDVDGVKRRTRAGMGRCQGGFCGSKVVEILARELGKPVNEITKNGGNSKIIYERTK